MSPKPAAGPGFGGLLTRGEDYASARPSLVRRKVRALELKTGAPRAKPGLSRDPIWKNATAEERERQIAEQAEATYVRLVGDWKAGGRKAGAGATKERAS
jgi:transposase